MRSHFKQLIFVLAANIILIPVAKSQSLPSSHEILNVQRPLKISGEIVGLGTSKIKSDRISPGNPSLSQLIETKLQLEKNLLQSGSCRIGIPAKLSGEKEASPLQFPDKKVKLEKDIIEKQAIDN